MRKLIMIFAALFISTAIFATEPTRPLPKNGTRVNLVFGKKKIPAVLNDSKTARALITKLPYTVSVSRYSHDFCGNIDMRDFPYEQKDVFHGWKNGDINITTTGDYISFLFAGENDGSRWGMVNLGVLDCPIEELSSLSGSYDVRIEKAE